MRAVAFIKQNLVTFLQKKQEGEMPVVRCPKCQTRRELQFKASSSPCTPMVLRGIITCSNEKEHAAPYDWPITVSATAGDATITNIADRLPAAESDALHGTVLTGLKQDIQEAERAHYSQCYKASVVMCRRALQLGLLERGISDGPLGTMLAAAKGTVIKSNRANTLVEGIKDFGDGGAHKKEEIDPQDAAMVIHVTVQVLNELFS